MDVITIVTSSNVKKVESNHESANVKNNGDAVEPKTVRKNSFRPPVIKGWNSNDDSEVELIPNVEDKTVRPSTEKIKFIKSGKINTAGASVNTVVRPVNTAGSKTTVNHQNNMVAPSGTMTRNKCLLTEYEDYDGVVLYPLEMVKGNPQQKEYKEKGVIDSGCSRHMTGNKCYLTEYEDYDGGFVSFGDGKGRISGKDKIKTGTLDFDNSYLLTFKLLDESQVLLRVPRKDNIYSVDLKSIVPTKGLTCLFAKDI
ncbi:hypothetical protein Tco_1074829 [Tanacetum coccineum]